MLKIIIIRFFSLLSKDFVINEVNRIQTILLSSKLRSSEEIIPIQFERYSNNWIKILSDWFIPFSKRKGYTAVKKCLKFVCPTQSKTSFSIFYLFDVLIILCYRLLMSRNPNPRLEFSSRMKRLAGERLDADSSVSSNI